MRDLTGCDCEGAIRSSPKLGFLLLLPLLLLLLRRSSAPLLLVWVLEIASHNRLGLSDYMYFIEPLAVDLVRMHMVSIHARQDFKAQLRVNLDRAKVEPVT